MLINLPSDFTDIRFNILNVEHSETYNTNWVVTTNIPQELQDVFSIALINENRDILIESLKILKFIKNDDDNISAIVDVSSTINLPRGKYYLIPTVRGIFSANLYPVTLINEQDADNVVDPTKSGFTPDVITIFIDSDKEAIK